MKKLFLLLIISTSSFAQRFFTETGSTNFEASIPTLVPVKATNEKSKVILDTASNEIAILLYITDFEFKIPLMQEHFNENYMNTERFPKASFTGKFISENEINGMLTIKGISQEINIEAEKSKNENITVSGNFKIKPEAFKIKVPKIVSRKMAEEVTIRFNYTLLPKN